MKAKIKLYIFNKVMFERYGLIFPVIASICLCPGSSMKTPFLVIVGLWHALRIYGQWVANSLRLSKRAWKGWKKLTNVIAIGNVFAWQPISCQISLSLSFSLIFSLFWLGERANANKGEFLKLLSFWFFYVNFILMSSSFINKSIVCVRVD